MPLLGAHISVAGGLDRAPERGRRATCDVIQVFTKSNVQWAAPPIRKAQRERFFRNLERFEIPLTFAHSCYLINLCSADSIIRRRSRRALATELKRCAKLRLPYLVLHPGAHGGLGEEEGLDWVVDGAAWALEQTAPQTDEQPAALLFETTAGQGTGLGWRFEHLAAILERLDHTSRVGVCFDTCHVFAAGYDLRTPKAYRRTMAEFDRVVGVGRILTFHLNDSRGDLGSRLDRHAHIGHGKIGLAGFQPLLNDKRFASRPMVIETPKGAGGPDLDIANLRRLRSLIRPSRMS